MKLGYRVWSVAMLAGVVGAMVACSGDVGPLPTAPTTSGAGADGDGPMSAQSLPNAVFRTVPAADAGGTISGNNPLLVQFNNCQSRPANEDDDLKFSYDFDGDGTVDAFGHCRWEHTYTKPASPRVCVSDRRGNDVCQTWDVRPSPVSDGPASARVASVTFTIDYIPDGGLAFPFEFYLNGSLLGTASTSGVPFQCPAPALTFTATNPAWIDGAANTLRFLKTPPGVQVWPAIGWVHVEVKRTDGSSQGACLYDADGGAPCMAGPPNSCLFPPNNWTPIDVSTTMTF